MSDSLNWWSESSSPFLDEALTFINSARRWEYEPVTQCDNLCKALNKLWNAFFLFRDRGGRLTITEQEKDRSDTQAFAQLLLNGLSTAQKDEFVCTDSVRRLVEFAPQIMSHAALLRQRYDPSNISDDQRRKASDEHRQLVNAYQRYFGTPADASLRDALLKKIAQLLFVVRSNIAHSEKTPRGPDFDKTKRDRAVSQITAEVIVDLLDVLLDHPSRRLAVYGTLAPGQPNTSMLDGIIGEWRDGTVYGDVEDHDGLPQFHWRLNRSSVRVKVLNSSNLEDEFGHLDRFEGPQYRRILVPVEGEGRIQVCNIYEGVVP